MRLPRVTDIRRGSRVLIDTDLQRNGQPLRGKRVCTCGGVALHAHSCPVDMPLTRDEVLAATAGSPS